MQGVRFRRNSVTKFECSEDADFTSRRDREQMDQMKIGTFIRLHQDCRYTYLIKTHDLKSYKSDICENVYI